MFVRLPSCKYPTDSTPAAPLPVLPIHPSFLSSNDNLIAIMKRASSVFGFRRLHAALQAKILVFLTTGKQVKFALEVFRRLRPGVVLRALHGKMKQMKRMAVYYDFCQVCVPSSHHLPYLHMLQGRVC